MEVIFMTNKLNPGALAASKHLQGLANVAKKLRREGMEGNFTTIRDLSDIKSSDVSRTLNRTLSHKEQMQKPIHDYLVYLGDKTPESILQGLTFFSNTTKELSEKLRTGIVPGIGHAISALPEVRVWAHTSDFKTYPTIPYKEGNILAALVEEGGDIPRTLPKGSVIVAGILLNKQMANTKRGVDLSLVATIKDKQAEQDIVANIRKTGLKGDIVFW